MQRLIAITACAGLVAVGAASTASAQVRAGATCPKAKVGKTTVRGGVTLKCTKTKKGRVWRKVTAPAPAPTPTPAPAPSAGGGAGIVPSGSWECGIGYYPYTSYKKLITSGSSYTVSNVDGSSASSGTIVAGTHAPISNGTPIKFVGGGWDGFKGEYATAGTVTSPGRPPITVNQVYVDGGLDNDYYPGTCSPK